MSSILTIRDLTIKLSDTKNKQINDKIDKFTNEMGKKGQSANYYSSARNTYKAKAIEDIALGKKAEYIVEHGLFKHLSYPHIPIDLEIRKGRKKGWKCDLPYRELFGNNYYDIHVKACSQKTYKFCNDYSWTFQIKNKTGYGGKDDIFKNNANTTELVAFVYLENPTSNIGIIKAILPWSEVESLLRDPIKPTLIGLKKCLYFGDLNNE